MALRTLVSTTLLVAFLSFARGASGATWYVDASVPSSGDGTTWEAAFQSIQQGIDAASDGETVIVAQGTYRENIQFKGKNFVLRSTDPLDASVVAGTIVDASAHREVCTFAGTEDESCLLSGFTIRNGSATYGGGIRGGDWGGDHTRATIRNNIITGNRTQTGAALWSCDGTIENNVISGNSVTSGDADEGWGGGPHACQGAVLDCIIWGNSAPSGPQLNNSSTPTYSCIQDWLDGGQGNIGGYPHFVDLENGDFHLWSWSPCIDGGDPASQYSNEPQPNGDRVNMGAYGNTPEAASKSPDTDSDGLPDDWELYWFGDLAQDGDADGGGDGRTNIEEYRDGPDPAPLTNQIHNVTKDAWYLTIQAALSESEDDDEIVVYPGLYEENINFGGKNVVLRSTDPLDADIVASTVIDGAGDGSVVTFAGTENARCVLSGFTIRNGQQNEKLGGGGIYGAGTRAGIVYNRIVANGSSGDGGGMYDCDGLIAKNLIAGNGSVAGGGLANCDGIIEDNIITGNSGDGGGLIRCRGRIRRNRILHNRGAFGAGLFWCGGTIEHNVVAGNQVEGAEDPGGGLCKCTGTVRNNLIVGNWATWRGGGVAFGEGLLVNNTIAANRAGVSGGGIANHDGGIVNCVIWANGAPSDSQIHDSTVPTYSCIEDWTGAGEGNVTDFPMFLAWPGATGQWTDAPIFDERTWQTTLVDAGASWLPDALKGLLINPETSQPLQFLIASNTETTISVWGYVLQLADAGDVYEVFDYRLDPESPCVDAGNNALEAGRFDLDGSYRCIGTKGKPGWSGRVDYVEADPSGAMTLMWRGFVDVGAYECQVSGPVPETFSVQTRDSMQSADWVEVFAGNVCQWTDAQPLGGKRFYRVEVK